MTKRRKEKLEASLAMLERVEQRLISQGKQLSKTFYAMKEDVMSELAAGECQNEKDLFIRADGNDAGGRRINTNMERNKTMEKNTRNTREESRVWQATRETQGSITILDPSIFDGYAYPFIEMGWQIGEDINPMLYTRKEWAKHRSTPFYNNVEADKVVLLQRKSLNDRNKKDKLC